MKYFITNSTIGFILIFSLVSCQKDNSPNALKIPKSGLIADYQLNGNAMDESGNSNNGAIYGAIPTQGRNNDLNGAYSFDGVNDYIELPTSAALNTDNDFSIEAWIKKDGFSNVGKYSDDAIFGQSDGPDGTDYPMILLEMMNDNTIRGFIRGSSNPYLDIYTQVPVSENSWHHIVMVRTKYENSLRIYLDGILIQEGVLQLVGNTQTNDSVTIGACYDDLQSLYRFFFGDIDMVRIWSVSLTQTQIEALHTDNYTIE
jgi:hypothetical protein